MRNQRPVDQVHDGMTSKALLEAMERVRKALSEYRAELVYEFGLFLDFPTDGNQEALQAMCARYRHLWMRAHDRPDEEQEERSDE